MRRFSFGGFGIRNIKSTIFIPSVVISLILLFSCGKTPDDHTDIVFENLSFRDFPDVTDYEIKAIEALQNEYDYFIYGMVLSTEAFKINGEVRGFTALFCEWLTNFFGITFQPRLYSWFDLLAGLESHEISFSGELTPTEDRFLIYQMSSPIISRPLKYFRLAGSRSFASISEERLLRYGFIEGTATINTVVSELEPGTYEVVLLNDISLVYDALKSGSIDAFYYSVTAEASFVQYEDIQIYNFYPLYYRPISLVTQNPDLTAIISVIDKVMEAGGLRHISSMYNQGEREFLVYKLYSRLTEEEHEYLKNRSVVPIGVDPGNYPGCFFDRREREWGGIFLDVLDEVSALTGLTFKRMNDEYTKWSEITRMLKDGEIALVPELTYIEERTGMFLWTETAMMTDNYALISKSDFPNLKINEILYARVGLARNTAFYTVFRRWFPNHRNTVEYESMEEVFGALQRGEIDMVMANQKNLLYLTHYLELPNFKTNIVFDYTINVKPGFNVNEVMLCSIIDKALGIVDLKGISNQWMHRTYDYRVKVAEAQYPWFIGSSVLLACVLVLFAILFILSRNTSKKLERIVGKRTHELELKTATLTTLFDSIPDLIFTKDLDLRYTQCNKSMTEHFNFHKEDIIGKTSLVSFGLLQEISDKHNDIFRKVIQSGQIHTTEGTVPRYEGTAPVFESTHAPLILNDKAIGVLGISRDITKRKEMEEAALAASHSKSIFLANMSHEIRTPMNSIIGFCELALNDSLPLKTKEYLAKILDNAEGLLQIINDILDISKVESGKMELEKIPFDIQEVLASCKTLITPKAEEKGLQLYFYAEPCVGKNPLGDPTRLRQVLVNLLSNAVKFTNQGIIKLCAIINDKTDNTVTIHFTVRDSGIGMTPQQIEKIFEPFMQAETGTTRKYGGTGLGLPITKNIVEMMGGKLVVDSSPGIGSKFSFDIVFNTVDAVISQKPKNKFLFNESERPVFIGEVLVCEDNAMNQQVICDHLAKVGLKTVIAENGKEGLELIQTRIKNGIKLFDLVFMDIYMPVMDGLEASAKILELDTGIPVIAMTANVMSNDMDFYSMSGMYECVGKPFTTQELWRCLLTYLTPVRMEQVNNAQMSARHQFSLPENHNELNGNVVSDDDFEKSLEIMFYKTNLNKYDEISAALKQNNITLAHRLVHTLKSNAGQINKSNLQSAAADIENKLKDGVNNVTEQQLKLLQTELSAVLSWVESYHSSQNSINQINNVQDDLDEKSVQELFEKLEPLLKMGNPECQSLLGSIYRLPVSNELKQLFIKQLEEFDFDNAYITFSKFRGIFTKET